MSLQISIREFGDVTILDLLGRSTFERESELLQNRLGKLIANGVRNVLLNLKELTDVDSSGVAVIITTYISLKRQDGDLKLLCPCGRVPEVLTLFRLLYVIPTFDDETQALANFRPRGYSATG